MADTQVKQQDLVPSEASVRRNLRESYHHVFDVCTDIGTQYQRSSSLEGDSSINPIEVDTNIHLYKAFLDNLEDDSVPEKLLKEISLEIYDRVRKYLFRGHTCDSWLQDEASSLYYGVSVNDNDGRIVHLPTIYKMIEYLKRASQDDRNKVAVLRLRLIYNVYRLFIEWLRFDRYVSGNETRNDKNLESDIAELTKISTESLNELTSISRKHRVESREVPREEAPGPFGGLSSLFPTVLQTLKTSLPMVTEGVKNAMRQSGANISSKDQRMIDHTMSRVTHLLEKPEDLQRLVMAGLSSGPEGISNLVKAVLDPAELAQMSSADDANDEDEGSSGSGRAGPAPPAPEGPCQD